MNTCIHAVYARGMRPTPDTTCSIPYTDNNAGDTCIRTYAHTDRMDVMDERNTLIYINTRTYAEMCVDERGEKMMPQANLVVLVRVCVYVRCTRVVRVLRVLKCH